MIVRDILSEDFKIVAGEEGLDNQIKGVYIGDLLSWVMGKAREFDVWITIQGHLNIIAVAALTGVSCIIVAEGAEIEADTIKKAELEDILLISTKLTSYDVAKMFALKYNL